MYILEKFQIDHQLLSISFSASHHGSWGHV